MRACTVRSLAKINLDLRVLHKRPDGFHELRTIFQTISLADTIAMAYEPARQTVIDIEGSIDIPDNLIVRAAHAVLEASKLRAHIRFTLSKRIPMGAGLGGGSSNAAAVLLALPALTGKPLPLDRLTSIGTQLGSDVPFFLQGGTALGIGRGEELFPLPAPPARTALIAASDVHVSTPEAYRALQRPLTNADPGTDTGNFGSLVWELGENGSPDNWSRLCVNDFEGVVFARHPPLLSIRNQLRRLGARPALMSGSGSAVFGLFESKERADEAAARFKGSDIRLHKVALVSRRRYRAMWFKQLREHVSGNIWPPQSRYAHR